MSCILYSVGVLVKSTELTGVFQNHIVLYNPPLHFKIFLGEFLGGPVARAPLPLQGARVQSLVGELRSHMRQGTAKKKKKY